MCSRYRVVVSMFLSNMAVLACIFIAESLFFVWHRRHVKVLNQSRQAVPDADIIGTVETIANYVARNDPVEFWRGWFKGEPREVCQRIRAPC